MKGRLYIICGCSGVGKGTLVKLLLEKNPHIKLSISATTRNIRLGEIDGENYFFISKEEFQNAVKNDEFLEWAEFSGNFYGTKKAYVEKELENGNDVLLEIEVKGAKQIKEKIPDVTTIFIMPPSFEILEKRLRGRCSEDEETIRRRLNEANREMNEGKKFDYIIVNDDLQIALNSLQQIFNTGD